MVYLIYLQLLCFFFFLPSLKKTKLFLCFAAFSKTHSKTFESFFVICMNKNDHKTLFFLGRNESVCKDDAIESWKQFLLLPLRNGIFNLLTEINRK